jgi:peptidoglycan/xylan/chitin deacetylase (PgdA/CDA1 family)
MKDAIQNVIRTVHLGLFDHDLPDRLAIYLHNLERSRFGAFEQFVNYFREQSYEFVGPDTFLQDGAGKRIFLSFDDNHRSWFEAVELFSNLNVNATFYVNTCVLRDRTTPSEISRYYDRIAYEGTRVPLSTGELLALASAGHAIGSHTHSHRMLSTLNRHEACEEIRRGKLELENSLGTPVRHFSHPFGMRRHFPEELRQYCCQIGVETIANAIPGMQHSVQSPFWIYRSSWRLDCPLIRNVQNIRVDARLFERLTGRSALGA